MPDAGMADLVPVPSGDPEDAYEREDEDGDLER